MPYDRNSLDKSLLDQHRVNSLSGAASSPMTDVEHSLEPIAEPLEGQQHELVCARLITGLGRWIIAYGRQMLRVCSEPWLNPYCMPVV